MKTPSIYPIDRLCIGYRYPTPPRQRPRQKPRPEISQLFDWLQNQLKNRKALEREPSRNLRAMIKFKSQLKSQSFRKLEQV